VLFIHVKTGNFIWRVDLNSETDATAPDPRERKTYYIHMTLTRRIVTGLVSFIFSLISIRQVRNAEKLPPSGAVIVAANHISNYDIFPLQLSLSRPLYCMGKEELFRNVFLDWLLRKLGGFPVYRGEKDAWAFCHSEHILEKGEVLFIFPEGTRNRGKGLVSAKTGAARLAQKMGCPIVPVAVDGTQHMFRNFPRRTKISFTVGDPIFPRPDETHLNLTDRLMFTLASMLPPKARGVYSHRPPGF
jgi:1-acyl-sn-glycerol-3-phosphate acyltransferase